VGEPAYQSRSSKALLHVEFHAYNCKPSRNVTLYPPKTSSDILFAIQFVVVHKPTEFGLESTTRIRKAYRGCVNDSVVMQVAHNPRVNWLLSTHDKCPSTKEHLLARLSRCSAQDPCGFSGGGEVAFPSAKEQLGTKLTSSRCSS
jgi:hypothetical protein